MATVRVADDVNVALKAMAAADPAGRSVTQIVDDVLRHHVGLATTGPDPAPAARARASVGRPRARAARAPRDPALAGQKCPHPVGRRIGNMCMACGATT